MTEKFHVTWSTNYVNQTLPALAIFQQGEQNIFLKVYPCK